MLATRKKNDFGGQRSLGEKKSRRQGNESEEKKTARAVSRGREVEGAAAPAWGARVEIVNRMAFLAFGDDAAEFTSSEAPSNCHGVLAALLGKRS